MQNFTRSQKMWGGGGICYKIYYIVMGNLIQKSPFTNAKNMEAFDTRFTECSCKKLPIIAQKAKILERMQIFTSCQ